MAGRRHVHFLLLHIEPGTDVSADDLFYTDATVTITYDGDEYVPMPLSRGDIVTDSEGNQAVGLTFKDIHKVIRQLFYTQNWSKRPTTLYEVWPAAQRVDAPITVTSDDLFIRAKGRASTGIANLEDENEPVTIAIVPNNDAEGAKGPAQGFGSGCRYVADSPEGFKGIQCGYVGPETTCDGLLTRCIALGNRARYGGFPFAPKPGAKLHLGSGVMTVGSR
jgi:hypothetical protein